MSEQLGRDRSVGDRPVVVLTASEGATMHRCLRRGDCRDAADLGRTPRGVGGLSPNLEHRIVEGLGTTSMEIRRRRWWAIGVRWG